MNQPKEWQKRSQALPANLTAVRVRVPGSSANLGPGFDTLALAYQLYCTLEFRLLETDDASVPLITLKGRCRSELPGDRSNLVYSVLSNVWQNKPDLLSRVRITIDSDIPLGKGLGSSAAAITGTLFAAMALGQELPGDSELLRLAAEIEGHADNVSASLLGGLVVCACREKSSLPVTQKLEWPPKWATIVSVPATALSTKKARAVLPYEITRQDAVYNLQKLALLLASVQNKDETAMHEALHDRLHEPYRSALVPQLESIRKLVENEPVLGCVLSGAGSSVLTVVPERHKQQLLKRLHEWHEKHDKKGEILDLYVDREGLKVSYE